MERPQFGDNLVGRCAEFKSVPFLKRKSGEEIGLCLIEEFVQFGRHADEAEYVREAREIDIPRVGLS